MYFVVLFALDKPCGSIVFHMLHCVTITTQQLWFPSFSCDILISGITLQVELVCRVCLVLLQTHHNQLTATPAARSLLTELKDILYCRVKVILLLLIKSYEQLRSILIIVLTLAPGMQGYYRLQPRRNGSYKSTGSLFLPKIWATRYFSYKFSWCMLCAHVLGIVGVEIRCTFPWCQGETHGNQEGAVEAVK